MSFEQPAELNLESKVETVLEDYLNDSFIEEITNDPHATFDKFIIELRYRLIDSLPGREREHSDKYYEYERALMNVCKNSEAIATNPILKKLRDEHEAKGNFES